MTELYTANTSNTDIKILVVDDIPKNIQVVGSLLGQYDYDIYFADNGQSALEQISKVDFDLILLDVMMPNMDGFEVCRRMRKSEKSVDIPIIFLTAKAEAKSIVEGFKLGGQDYVTKPFEGKELISRVQTHIELQQKRKFLKDINSVLEKKVAERTVDLRRANNKLSSMNEQLAMFDRTKNDFITLINHELRTPLNGISGLSRILEKSLKSTKHEQLIFHMRKSADRLQKLSETALLITSLKANNYESVYEKSAIYPILNDIKHQFADKVSEKNITFNIEASEDDSIKTDEKLLRICVENVVENAVKFSANQGVIEIRTKFKGNFLFISIADTGSGFSKHALDNIFDMFNLTDLMHHSEGFGLGLATSHLIMTTLSGLINAENRPEGGAIVTLQLPN